MTPLLPFIEQQGKIFNQSINIISCPSDPRLSSSLYKGFGGNDYGVTWYVPLATRDANMNDGTLNNAMIVRETNRNTCATPTRPTQIRLAQATDGTTNTIMITERPPNSDLFWGWWGYYNTWHDPHTQSTANSNKLYFSGTSGTCPTIATFRHRRRAEDNCSFNAPWSYHDAGDNQLMGDGSVRIVTTQAATAFLPGSTTVSIFDAMATRNGAENASLE
jgi:hypothetical protein